MLFSFCIKQSGLIQSWFPKIHKPYHLYIIHKSTFVASFDKIQTPKQAIQDSSSSIYLSICLTRFFFTPLPQNLSMNFFMCHKYNEILPLLEIYTRSLPQNVYCKLSSPQIIVYPSRCYFANCYAHEPFLTTHMLGKGLFSLLHNIQTYQVSIYHTI